jgi:hypothetical protein
VRVRVRACLLACVRVSVYAQSTILVTDTSSYHQTVQVLFMSRKNNRRNQQTYARGREEDMGNTRKGAKEQMKL